MHYVVLPSSNGSSSAEIILWLIDNVGPRYLLDDLEQSNPKGWAMEINSARTTIGVVRLPYDKTTHYYFADYKDLIHFKLRWQ